MYIHAHWPLASCTCHYTTTTHLYTLHIIHRRIKHTFFYAASVYALEKSSPVPGSANHMV
jgi:hypothetical protein